MATCSRVISLLPSATDIVGALGLAHTLVGRSHECDAEGTSAIPPCSESRISTEQGLTSGEVHAAASTAGAGIWEAAYGLGPLPRAGALVQWALSPYLTNANQLRELQPDVVLTQVQFSGGATNEPEIHQALCEWVGKPVTLLHMDPQSLEDVWQDILRVGECLESRQVALDVVTNLKDRMAVVSSMALGRERKRVVCVQWSDPLFLAGAWVPHLVRLAGGVDLSEEKRSCPPIQSHDHNQSQSQSQSRNQRDGNGGGAAREGMEERGDVIPHDWQSIFEMKPNILVFMICGSNLRESIVEADRVIKKGLLEQMKGVERSLVAVVDGAKLFSRPGPTLVESLEVLAEILHPESQSFGHGGLKWQALEI